MAVIKRTILLSATDEDMMELISTRPGAVEAIGRHVVTALLKGVSMKEVAALEARDIEIFEGRTDEVLESKSQIRQQVGNSLGDT